MTNIFTLLIVLSFLGFVNASFLLWKHYTKKLLSCPFNDKCEKVTESKWSKIFGIRNDVLSIFYYLTSILFVLYILFFDESVKIIFILINLTAILFSMFLLYVQAKIIKKYCFYCLISAILNFFIFIFSFYLWFLKTFINIYHLELICIK